MEELRSTEMLDREIQEDARRKAEKILKASDAECAHIRDEVTSRIERTRLQKEEEYRKALEDYERDQAAALPLERQRKLVSFIDSQVQSALDAWLSSIGPDRRLSLYARFFSRAAKALSGNAVTVSASGYSEQAVRDALMRASPNLRVSAFESISESRARASGLADGLIVEDESGTIRLRATSEEIRQELLSNKREELAKALFGGRIPE